MLFYSSTTNTNNNDQTHYDAVSLVPRNDGFYFDPPTSTSRSRRLKRKLSKKSSITLMTLFILSFFCYLSYKVTITHYHLTRNHNLHSKSSGGVNEEQVFNTLFRNFKFVDDLKSEKLLGESRTYPNTSNSEKNKDSSSDELIYLDNPNAYQLLIDSVGSYHQYFAYNSRGLDVQINQAFCGLATASSVLNSLRSVVSTLPQDPMYSPYLYATQKDLINDCVSNRFIPSSDSVLTPPYGITLTQLNGLLQCWLPKAEGWAVRMKYITKETNRNRVRRELIQLLNGGTSRVLVNYNRQILGQIGGGHFSPLVAYNPKEDVFLINDVAKYKYPPVFVPFSKLYDAMASIDSCGVWNYPNGQNDLDFNVTSAATASDSATLELLWGEIKKTLGCQEEFRGFISIKKT